MIKILFLLITILSILSCTKNQKTTDLSIILPSQYGSASVYDMGKTLRPINLRGNKQENLRNNVFEEIVYFRAGIIGPKYLGIRYVDEKYFLSNPSEGKLSNSFSLPFDNLPLGTDLILNIIIGEVNYSPEILLKNPFGLFRFITREMHIVLVPGQKAITPSLQFGQYNPLVKMSSFIGLLKKGSVLCEDESFKNSCIFEPSGDFELKFSLCGQFRNALEEIKKIMFDKEKARNITLCESCNNIEDGRDVLLNTSPNGLASKEIFSNEKFELYYEKLDGSRNNILNCTSTSKNSIEKKTPYFIWDNHFINSEAQNAKTISEEDFLSYLTDMEKKRLFPGYNSKYKYGSPNSDLDLDGLSDELELKNLNSSPFEVDKEFGNSMLKVSSIKKLKDKDEIQINFAVNNLKLSNEEKSKLHNCVDLEYLKENSFLKIKPRLGTINGVHFLITKIPENKQNYYFYRITLSRKNATPCNILPPQPIIGYAHINLSTNLNSKVEIIDKSFMENGMRIENLTTSNASSDLITKSCNDIINGAYCNIYPSLNNVYCEWDNDIKFCFRKIISEKNGFYDKGLNHYNLSPGSYRLTLKSTPQTKFNPSTEIELINLLSDNNTIINKEDFLDTLEGSFVKFRLNIFPSIDKVEPKVKFLLLNSINDPGSELATEASIALANSPILKGINLLNKKVKSSLNLNLAGNTASISNITLFTYINNEFREIKSLFEKDIFSFNLEECGYYNIHSMVFTNSSGVALKTIYPILGNKEEDEILAKNSFLRICTDKVKNEKKKGAYWGGILGALTNSFGELELILDKIENCRKGSELNVFLSDKLPDKSLCNSSNPTEFSLEKPFYSTKLNCSQTSFVLKNNLKKKDYSIIVRNVTDKISDKNTRVFCYSHNNFSNLILSETFSTKNQKSPFEKTLKVDNKSRIKLSFTLSETSLALESPFLISLNLKGLRPSSLHLRISNGGHLELLYMKPDYSEIVFNPGLFLKFSNIYFVELILDINMNQIISVLVTNESQNEPQQSLIGVDPLPIYPATNLEELKFSTLKIDKKNTIRIDNLRLETLD